MRNRRVPITIYKNGELLEQCDNIQAAGRFLKSYTNDTNFRFTKIQNGYVYGATWSYNGATYTFTAPREDQNRRKLELEGKKKKGSL
ncbi:hypothetical protein [Peribacillus butanolivorans]|uniref:hypothetical protein n=1 Tax=Peribacillus butanolivorans TaxID=421767 RepID=UPI0036C95606